MINLTLITGPMFSGKTTHLAHALHTAQAAGTRIALIRPMTDTRKNRTIGFIRPLIRITPHNDPTGADTTQKLCTTPLIAIDEVQFIAGWTVHFLLALQAQSKLEKIRVIAAGLDLKADATIWPGMDALAERADLHIRHTTTCARCGKPATMTLATSDLPPDGIKIGDEGYQPVCRACWEKAQADKQRLQTLLTRQAIHHEVAA